MLPLILIWVNTPDLVAYDCKAESTYIDYLINWNDCFKLYLPSNNAFKLSIARV